MTLIFGLGRYDEVFGAFLDGLEAADRAGHDLRGIASVASFFVSRVDTEVDRRLAAGAAAPELFGRAAVAQAVLAYELFAARSAEPRFTALAAKGARVQRPLWASTSTKNPAYPDLLYVDTLIGPDTVNTMPEATIEAFVDHGTVARTIDADVEAARAARRGRGARASRCATSPTVLEREGVPVLRRQLRGAPRDDRGGAGGLVRRALDVASRTPPYDGAVAARTGEMSAS